MAMLVRLAASLFFGRRLIRQAVPLAGSQETADAIRAQLGIGRLTSVVVAEGIASPVTYGYLKAYVALPMEAAAWPDERLRSVLLHELAHVRRLDWLSLLAAQLLGALQWFNPLLWHAIARFRAEAEHACDDEVLLHGQTPGGYAKDLLDIARHISRDRSPISVGMARRPQVESRIALILSSNTARNSLRLKTVVKALLLTLLITIPLAGLRPLLLEAAASPLARGVANSLLAGFGGLPGDNVNLQPAPVGIDSSAEPERSLGNGLQVSLEAISDKKFPFNVGEAWQPNGRPYAVAIMNYNSAQHGGPDGVDRRSVVLRLKSKNARHLTLLSFAEGAAQKFGWLKDEQQWGSYMHVSLEAGEPLNVATSLDFGRKGGISTSTYDLAIAEGPWKTDRILPNTLKCTVQDGIYVSIGTVFKGSSLYMPEAVAQTAPEEDLHSVKKLPKVPSRNVPQVQLLADGMDLSQRDRRIVPLDAKGRPIPFDGEDGSCGINIHHADAIRVAKYRIESREWTWLGFNNLMLSRSSQKIVLQPEPPHPIVAKNYEVTLPSGVRVRLAGVSLQARPSNEDELWQPNGRPWKGNFEYPFRGWRNETTSDMRPVRTRSLLIGLRANKPCSVSVNGFVPGIALAGNQADSEGWDLYQEDARVSREESLSSVGQLTFGDLKENRYLIAIADGSWSLKGEFRNSLQIPADAKDVQIGAGESVSASVTFPEGSHDFNSSRFTQTICTGLDMSKMAWRVIPLDAQGKRVEGESGNTTNFSSTILTPSVARRVVKYRVESRPWTWIEFRDLHLDPPDRPELAIRTGSASGIAANSEVDLGGGTKFYVRGIGSTRLVGDLFHASAWWRGDGRLLASSRGLFDTSMRREQAKNPILFEASVQSDGRPEPSPNSVHGGEMMFTVSKFMPEEKEADAFKSSAGWEAVRQEDEGRSCMTHMGVLERTEVHRYATAIVGIARGPWKVQSSRSFDLARIKPGVGIRFEAGKTPSASYDRDTGQLRLVFGYPIAPLRYAARVVAVDGHGRRVPVDTSQRVDSPPPGLWISFDHRQTKVGGDKGIPLSQVRSFDLEVCPYSFKYLRKLALQPSG